MIFRRLEQRCHQRRWRSKSTRKCLRPSEQRSFPTDSVDSAIGRSSFLQFNRVNVNWVYSHLPCMTIDHITLEHPLLFSLRLSTTYQIFFFLSVITQSDSSLSQNKSPHRYWNSGLPYLYLATGAPIQLHLLGRHHLRSVRQILHRRFLVGLGRTRGSLQGTK